MILITGGSGRLGKELVKLLPEALAPSHQELDVASFDSVYDYFQQRPVELVIHCAAYTPARGAERFPMKAYDVNVRGTRNLASYTSKEKACRFVLLSTCVFDGARGDYPEEEIPTPINEYQRTKVEAECTVQHLLKGYVIIRTNFIPRGRWPYLAAFSDRYANYLYVDQVAAAVLEIAKSDVTGVIHVSGSRKLSMYEAARLADRHVAKMTMASYSGPRLPIDMSLKSTRWRTYDLSVMQIQ